MQRMWRSDRHTYIYTSTIHSSTQAHKHTRTDEKRTIAIDVGEDRIVMGFHAVHVGWAEGVLDGREWDVALVEL